MVRILSVIVVICGFFLAISSFRIKHLENKNTSLETQKSELIEKMEELENAVEKFNRDNERANNTIAKVRTVVKTISEPCDCYNTAIDRELLGIIRGTD